MINKIVIIKGDKKHARDRAKNQSFVSDAKNNLFWTAVGVSISLREVGRILDKNILTYQSPKLTTFLSF